MNTPTTGARIKRAREYSNLTIKKLAGLVGVTERSIKRYESNQSTPDTHALIQLACIFDLSTDYLLGLSDRADTSFLDKYRTNNVFYRKALSNVPIPTENYYVVEYNPQREPYPMKGQMHWAGYDKNGKDLWCLRPVIVDRWLALMKKLPEKTATLIINDKEDFYTFLIYGGNALIAETTCKECLAHLLRPGTAEKCQS